MKKVWGSSELPRNTKIRIFNSMIKPVLLYGAETCRTTVTTMKKIQSFINTCLRRILRVRWPNTISNLELWQRTGQQPIEEEILHRRWRWVGHTLRKPASSTARHALFWNPQGKRKRGRPRNSWRCDLDADVKRSGHTWGQLENLAQDRDDWRALVRGLCPKLGGRQSDSSRAHYSSFKCNVTPPTESARYSNAND
ncbi:hypothetical protein PO909_024955 [Leuciscus waleckii]